MNTVTGNRRCSKADRHNLWAVPVLVYHRVASESDASDRCVPSVGCDLLDRHMSCLAALGYRTVHLADLVKPRMEPEGPSIVITFDDGWGSARRHALPVLQQHGMTATVFVTTDPAAGVFDPAREVDPPLRPEEWSVLAEAGWEIGSHTRTHPPLVECSDARIADELSRSRADLASATGRPVAFLATPFGLSNARVEAAARKIGYTGLCPGATGLSHWGQSPFSVRRIGIPSKGGMAEFQRCLTTSGARAAQLSGAVKTLVRRGLGHENSMRLRRALSRVRALAGDRP